MLLQNDGENFGTLLLKIKVQVFIYTSDFFSLKFFRWYALLNRISQIMRLLNKSWGVCTNDFLFFIENFLGGIPYWIELVKLWNCWLVVILCYNMLSEQPRYEEEKVNESAKDVGACKWHTCTRASWAGRVITSSRGFHTSS